MNKPTVAFGFLGTKLDGPTTQARWSRWRPSLCLCQQEDLQIARLELLYDPRFARLAAVVHDDLHSVSPDTEVVLRSLPLADPWDLAAVYAALHDFARSYDFQEDQEDYLVHITTGTHVAQICLFLLTESRHFPARLIQTSPPRQGETFTTGSTSIIDLDLSRYDRLAERFLEERREGVSLLKAGIETQSSAFNQMMEDLETVALRSAEPILLTGPTGAGKTQLARRIYELKRQRRLISGSWVEVNCATLRGDMAMSTLFGHVKGAFTGATTGRDGLLRAADGGMVFLDEIGDLPVDVQAMLLHALEDREFLPVGSDTPIQSRFQLIAGTNRELRLAVAQGRFRDDLLARIDLWSFRLPGLRERREDIEPNLDFELSSFTRQHGRRVTFNREARERFLEFARHPDSAWNGNFRDFRAAITRMATLARGGRITLREVQRESEQLRQSWQPAAEPRAADLIKVVLGASEAGQLDRFESIQLADVLEVCRRSRSLSEAGRTLFSASRQRKRSVNDADRLSKYLARFGLAWRTLSELLTSAPHERDPDRY